MNETPLAHEDRGCLVPRGLVMMMTVAVAVVFLFGRFVDDRRPGGSELQHRARTQRWECAPVRPRVIVGQRFSFKTNINGEKNSMNSEIST
jgi:hypothetical protein